MQLHDTDNSVKVTGGEAIQMTMDASSAVGFSLSIDKLYTYKIESVIREICSNARDSHVEAGIPNKPFDIFLPSDLSPYLVIKDYGTGLSKENAIKYLSQLYSSSKQNTNQAVGAYGIGSKSPFAISDSYNIETVKDGIKCSFQFFRSGRSLPQLMLLDESETDEPNGVTFRIHVRDLQRSKYEDALHTQMFMFNPKPNIDGTPWPYDPYDIIQTHGNINVYKAPKQKDFFGAYALEMGGVTYPFVPESVDPDCKSLFDGISRTINSGDIIVVSTPIGSVEVPGDRERIEYSDFTIQNLKKHLVNVAELFTSENCKEYIDNFSEAKNLLELESERHSFRNKVTYLTSFIKDVAALEISRIFKPYNFPIVNSDGNIVDVTLEIKANQIQKEDLGWSFPAPHYTSTETEFVFDANKNKVEVKKNVHLPKYSYANANRIYGGTAYSVDKYEELKTIRSSFASKIAYSSCAIVLVDTSSRPVAKTIENWQQEETSPKHNHIIIIKTCDRSFDVKAIEELYETVFNDCGAQVYKLSELKYTAKAVEKVTNATGFRKLVADYVMFTTHRQGSRYSRRPVQIKLSELNAYLESERSEQDEFFAYAFIDVNDNSIYLDEEHTIPLDEYKFHLLACGWGFSGKECLLMSKTTAKKYMPSIQQSGLPPLSEYIDETKFLNSRPKNYKTLLFNFVHLTAFSQNREFSNHAEPYLVELYQYIFGKNDPRQYSYQTIDGYIIADVLYSSTAYSSSKLRHMIKNREDEILWQSVYATAIYATKYRNSYISRMVNHINRNITSKYVTIEAAKTIEKLEKNNKSPDCLGSFLIKTALETVPKERAIEVAKKFLKRDYDQDVFNFS